MTSTHRDAPLYRQLRQLLIDKIESNEWQPGYKLPTEMELCEEFNVSRHTVRQALQFLQNQGLIERFQGRGTFVGRPKLANDLMMLFSPMRGMIGATSAPDLQFLHLTAAKPPIDVANRLRLAVDDCVYELKRLLVADGEPLLVVKNWLPQALFPDFDARYEAQGTVVGVLTNHYGLGRVSQHKELEVTILDEEEAEDLQVRAGAPGLLLTYVTRFADGRAFECRRVVVRGDRCRYYVDQEGPEFLV